jgi:hypothetical protein
MGSSSSKAVRKLPKAPPTWAGARTAGEFKYPEGVLPLGADKVRPPSRGPSGDSTKSPGGPLDYGVIHPSGAGTEHATGRKTVHASEKKDDSEFVYEKLFDGLASEQSSVVGVIAIMRDGVDPDFMANLSRLGQVAVPKPGLSFEKASSRRYPLQGERADFFPPCSKHLRYVPCCRDPQTILQHPLPLLQTISPLRCCRHC